MLGGCGSSTVRIEDGSRIWKCPPKDESKKNYPWVSKCVGVPERSPHSSSPHPEVPSRGLVGPSSYTPAGLQGDVGTLEIRGPTKSLLATEVVYQGTP